MTGLISRFHHFSETFAVSFREPLFSQPPRPPGHLALNVVFSLYPCTACESARHHATCSATRRQGGPGSRPVCQATTFGIWGCSSQTMIWWSSVGHLEILEIWWWIRIRIHDFWNPKGASSQQAGAAWCNLFKLSGWHPWVHWYDWLTGNYFLWSYGTPIS